MEHIRDSDARQIRERLDTLARLVAEAPLNLVSRRDRPVIREIHVAEAEAVTAALALAPGATLLDLGTGGGLPGLVIAILRPDVVVTCLDARAKKVRHVELMSNELRLTNVAVVARRAEEGAREARLRAAFDCVVSRALGAANVVAELGRGFVAPSGRLAVIKGPHHGEELARARAAAAGLRFHEPTVARVDAAPRPTWLLEMVAIGQPPPWVPRSNGVPQHDPLGSS